MKSSSSVDTCPSSGRFWNTYDALLIVLRIQWLDHEFGDLACHSEHRLSETRKEGEKVLDSRVSSLTTWRQDSG